MQTPQSKGSYVHFPASVKSYLLSVLAILVSAVPASFLAWIMVSSIGLDGVWRALVTVFFAMLFSVLFFAGLVAIGRVTGLTKPKL